MTLPRGARYRALFAATCALALSVALFAAPASGTDETGLTGWDCPVCHDGATGIPSIDDPFGPHGDYSATSNKCESCHTVHDAPEGFQLLPGSTITDTCFTCHDGTGGSGVYGSNGVVQAEHRVDTTSTVPGGDPSTGGDKSYTFSSTAVGAEGTLTCTDCHSPHASSTVATFTGDRKRTGGPWPNGVNGRVGNRLLKSRPNGIGYDIEYYGADWCAACHQGRASGGTVHNHPVESSTTVGAFYYEYVARVDGIASSNTETGTMGSTNRGYVMPDPRTSDQSGHDPLCQQCHEDARDVGDDVFGQISIDETFSPANNGAPPSYNPALQNFPHESWNPYFLIETDDDLCTNCHDTTGLP
jgi:predicted CXXCH cytochrome family protein